MLTAQWHTWQERTSVRELLAFPLLPHVFADCLRLCSSPSQTSSVQLRIQCVAHKVLCDLLCESC